VPPDNQNCPFIILLEAPSCPFPIGIVGVAGGGLVCHWRAFFPFFFLT